MFFRYNSLIKSSLNIYFEERVKGFSPEEARKKVIDSVVLESEKTRVLLEDKGFLNVIEQTIDPHLTEKQREIMENEGGLIIRKINLLILAICARQTERDLTTNEMSSYLNKIDKYFQVISQKYPDLKESKYSIKY